MPRTVGRILWYATGSVAAVACVTVAACVAAAAEQLASAPSTAPVTAPSDARPRLALAGFEMDSAADPRDVWIATAIEETLAWRLRRVPALIVVPTVRAHQARRELQEDGGAPPAWPRVVAALGAQRMVTGRCQGPADAVVLRLALLELVPAPHTQAEIALPAQRLFSVLDAATRWILEHVGVIALAPEDERLVFSPPARSPSALEYYARAVAAARADQFQDAGYCALQSLEYDNRYRPALAMLGQLELQRGGAGLAAAGARLRLLADLAQMQRDPLDWAVAELGQATLLQLSGGCEAAYTRCETSLGISYERREPYGQLAAINALCDLYLTWRFPTGGEPSEEQRKRFDRQSLRRAAEWQEVGLELLAQLGDVVAEAPAANKLALTYERLGEKDRALALHQRTRTAAERCGSKRNQATAWLYLGQWYQREQRWSEALDAMQRSLALASEAMQPVARLALAGVLQGQGNPAEALAQLQLAYTKLRAGDDLVSQLICARQIAELRMQLGQREPALAALQEAIDLAHVLERPEEAALREKLAEWQKQSP